MSEYRKKLIETALPLAAISNESAREKSLRHGHPSTLHLWWARRPLAACRAVLFGQLVDDPAAWPDRFPTEQAQDSERDRLFAIIEDLVRWENSSNQAVLDLARREIAQSFARGRIADDEATDRDRSVLASDVDAASVAAYIAEEVPPVHDPFAGGGSIPLEAQRLGLRTLASDLNPVAVLINKALIEIPPKFAGRTPVGPSRRGQVGMKNWVGAEGLAEDVRRYGEWMHKAASERINHLYPAVMVTPQMAQRRPSLAALVGKSLTVVAWLWARTVESPDPMLKGVHVPLVSSFYLYPKKKQEAWIEPIVDTNTRSFSFVVHDGPPEDPASVRMGTKAGRGVFRCLFTGTPITTSYIREKAMAGGLGSRLLAVVAEGQPKGKVFLSPDATNEDELTDTTPAWEPHGEVPSRLTGGTCHGYGLTTFAQLFTPRQLTCLTTLSDLLGRVHQRITEDARAAGWAASNGGSAGASEYALAVTTLLSFVMGRMADRHSSLTRWDPNPSGYAPKIANTFSRQALPMVWDYAEGNPFSSSSGNLADAFDWIAKVVATAVPASPSGTVQQADACVLTHDEGSVIVSTDPPYYDNIGYADLSDFFYVWLRPSLRKLYPDIFRTMLVPKATELVASAYRHGSAAQAEDHFLSGMSVAVARLARHAVSGVPITIYYAFKQSKSKKEGTSSTGWETFLSAVISSGLTITGTLPLRTELKNRLIGKGTNALASSIVLVCRQRRQGAEIITRGDFRRLLKAELPNAIRALHRSNIAPVDMAQASIGPGIAIFSRHDRVLEQDGSMMSVRAALQLINEIVDEIRGEEEADLDSETRFAITWFSDHQFGDGDFGDAETLATARNVSVAEVERSGVLKSAAGKVRLLNRGEMPDDWDPTKDKTLTVWECSQHLIKRLASDGESAAAALMAKMGPLAEHARTLAYRLFTTCERKNWAEEARAYNSLVIAWPELQRLAADTRREPVQGTFAGMSEEG